MPKVSCAVSASTGKSTYLPDDKYSVIVAHKPGKIKRIEKIFFRVLGWKKYMAARSTSVLTKTKQGSGTVLSEALFSFIYNISLIFIIGIRPVVIS